MEQDISTVKERLAALEINKAEQDILIENLQEDLKAAQIAHATLLKDIEPLKQHMIVSSALIKAVSVLGALIGLILGIVQVISKIR